MLILINIWQLHIDIIWNISIKTISQDYHPETKMFEYIYQFPIVQINIAAAAGGAKLL